MKVLENLSSCSKIGKGEYARGSHSSGALKSPLFGGSPIAPCALDPHAKICSGSSMIFVKKVGQITKKRFKSKYEQK